MSMLGNSEAIVFVLGTSEVPMSVPGSSESFTLAMLISSEFFTTARTMNGESFTPCAGLQPEIHAFSLVRLITVLRLSHYQVPGFCGTFLFVPSFCNKNGKLPVISETTTFAICTSRVVL